MVEHAAVDKKSSTDIPVWDKDDVRLGLVHESKVFDRTRGTQVRFSVGGFSSSV